MEDLARIFTGRGSKATHLHSIPAGDVYILRYVLRIVIAVLAYPEERDHTPSGMPHEHVYHISILLLKVGNDDFQVGDVIEEIAILPCPRRFMIAPSRETLSSEVSVWRREQRTGSRTGTSLSVDGARAASGTGSPCVCSTRVAKDTVSPACYYAGSRRYLPQRTVQNLCGLWSTIRSTLTACVIY